MGKDEVYNHNLALRETSPFMDEFPGAISHELRTPLTTIKGNIQLARLRLSYLERRLALDDPIVKSGLDEIYTMLNRAEWQVNVQNWLIRNLTDITNIQFNRLELNMELCNLTEIVINTVREQQSAFPTRTIHLSLHAPPSMPVIADAERIGQVLVNYLVNALKYASADRPVFIRLDRANSAAYISVRDEGPGLSASEQTQLWRRFQKVEGIKRQKGFSPGLGLGLYLCRAIIERHHGKTGVESAKGVGSTFWFTLPLATPSLLDRSSR